MQLWFFVLSVCLSIQSPAQDSFDELLGQSLSEEEIEESDEISKEELDRDSKTLKPFKERDYGDLTTLAELAPFEDIAVIQRRFLPKTSRFEVNPTLGFILNDAFFLTTDFGIRFGYHFSETIALEASAFYLTTDRKGITKDLEEKRNLLTKTFVTPNLFAPLPTTHRY